MVFFLSIFATNMTAFAILGSSGLAGYSGALASTGLMASSSGLVIPLTIFISGTRLWALGKRFWAPRRGCSSSVTAGNATSIGTAILNLALSAAMLIPYMIISIMGGGSVAEISTPAGTHAPMIPYAVGCAIVAVVVTVNVFFGPGCAGRYG